MKLKMIITFHITMEGKKQIQILHDKLREAKTKKNIKKTKLRT